MNGHVSFVLGSSVPNLLYSVPVLCITCYVRINIRNVSINITLFTRIHVR